jgi:hypothetical protein
MLRSGHCSSDPSSLHVSLSLFLFKVAVPPVLVALMSVIARRWGATVGGLIMGLPWMTGPVLFFLALDKGPDFAVRAAIGVEFGVLCIVAHILGYGLMARIAPWFVALPAGALSFAGAASATQSLDLPLGPAMLAGIGALLLAYTILPRPSGTPKAARLPWWDIPARMSVTFALVAAILYSADRLGAQLSGIVSSYPVILTVVGSFTHHQNGYQGVLRVLKGISLSLIGFCLFFGVVGFTLPSIGLLAFVCGAITSLAFSASLIALSRR